MQQGKAKMQQVSVRKNEMSQKANSHVRSEMDAFLRALSSYPARFEENPDVTFEEHCRSLEKSAKARSATAGS